MVLKEIGLINKADDLFSIVKAYNPDALAKVKKAYDYASKFHADQIRKSGEPYIIHPINVAYTLAQKNADEATLCACLLHDVLEDTPCTYEELKEAFGLEIANLVNGVTNLAEINFSTKEAEDLANLRKILVGLTKDPRIVLIKISDRLHNMRTLEYQAHDKQIAKAEETINFYAPLASFLGADCFKAELEALSLKYLDPTGYATTEELISSYAQEVNEVLNEMLVKINYLLSQNNIPADITIRLKHIYSVYKKIKSGQLPYDIHDFVAFKILVSQVSECYQALGIVHSLYRPVNVKFKDFISNPKNNMYQALHTTVYSPTGFLVQNRIKTYDMDLIDQNGLMSFWRSKREKAAGAMISTAEQKFQFLHGIEVMNEVYSSDSEFISHVQKELFSGKIVVLTMGGRTIELPIGATPVDVAYFLGDRIADTAIMVSVNEEPALFSTQLHEYDRVQIITTKGYDNPKENWEEYATTTKAKMGLKRSRMAKK